MSTNQANTSPAHERWSQEAAFFDRVASEQAGHIAPIDSLTLQRYTARSLRRRFKEEFRFRLLGDLHGKRVLDVGCGEGSNSITLAKLGAEVTGIDISPKSIDVARKRAEVNGVARTARFVCAPLEEAVLPQGQFDVIWGDSILHHLIGHLDHVLQHLTDWGKPGALMVFCEPVNFSNAVRRLRFMLPVKTDATPGERPLEPAELEIARRFLPDLQMRFYSLFGRFWRFILVRGNYERSPLPRRGLVNLLACADYALLSLPLIRNAGGYAVFYGHARRA